MTTGQGTVGIRSGSVRRVSVSFANRHAALVVACLAGLTVAAAILRFHGLGDGSINHTELYGPGVPLPADISEPPPRLTVAEMVRWHFHVEPHPPGWYLAMAGWVAVAGADLAALRVPSALLGVIGVLLTWQVGRQLYGNGVGLVAAAMLALHGFHIHWSGLARTYAAGVVLGLAATALLIAIMNGRRASPRLEVAYGATVVAGTQTVEFFWALIGMHVVWAALCGRAQAAAGPPGLRRLWEGTRMAQVQAAALSVGAPELAHAVYRARGDAAGEPTLRFLADYVGFGFALLRDRNASLPFEPGWAVAMPVAVLALLLLAMAFCAPARPIPAPFAGQGLPVAVRLAAALLPAALILSMAFIANSRNLPMAMVALLPIGALALPGLARAGARIVGRCGVWLPAPGPLLLLCIAIVLPLALFVLSFLARLTAGRAFLLFVPFLLILLSAGLVALMRFRWPAVLAVGMVAAILAGSAALGLRKPTSPRDYAGIADMMKPMMDGSDFDFISIS